MLLSWLSEQEVGLHPGVFLLYLGMWIAAVLLKYQKAYLYPTERLCAWRLVSLAPPAALVLYPLPLLYSYHPRDTQSATPRALTA